MRKIVLILIGLGIGLCIDSFSPGSAVNEFGYRTADVILSSITLSGLFCFAIATALLS